MRNRFLLCALSLLPLVACLSTSSGRKLPKNWWNQPENVEGLAGIGYARQGPNLSLTRNLAAAEGRAQLAASLEAEIQSLTELWAQEAGDLATPGSLSSLVNNESFIRQVVQTTLRGSNVIAYHTDEEKRALYALVVLSDPGTFTDNLVEKVDRELQDATYFETEARKSQARERLDALLDNKTKEYRASTPTSDDVEP